MTTDKLQVTVSKQDITIHPISDLLSLYTNTFKRSPKVSTQTTISLANKSFAHTPSYVLSVMMSVKARNSISLLLKHVLFTLQPM